MRSGDEKQTFKDVARELATAQSFISSPFIYLFDDKQVSSVTQSYSSIGVLAYRVMLVIFLPYLSVISSYARCAHLIRWKCNSGPLPRTNFLSVFLNTHEHSPVCGFILGVSMNYPFHSQTPLLCHDVCLRTHSYA